MSAENLLRSGRHLCRPSLGIIAMVLCLSGAARAQDSGIGTFTVNGKTVRFSNVYATLSTMPGASSEKYLIMLVSDVPVAAADRTPARLQSAAAAGTLHAVRIRWKYGVDEVAVAPYHRDVAESGKAVPGVATLNLTALNDANVHAEFKSKMLGQTWHFNAIVKAAIVKGGDADLEPLFDLSAPSTSAASGAKDPTALKRQLGSMKYEFTKDAFFQAIGDHNAAAVNLFMQAGMSPNQKNEQNRFALNHAVLFCANAPEDAAAVIAALVAAKADIKTKDPDNGTTALVGAVQSCPPSAINVLVKAGSDLTAKSNGGMTALQLAKIFGRADVAEILGKAGAK